jgi:putative protease
MPLRPPEPTLTPQVVRRPEILAPAGDLDSFAAALAAGADAVYLGLDEGFNARARATNFPIDTLPEVVARAHRAGVKVFVTTNTLVFEEELTLVEPLLRAMARAGVDALIIQDPAVAMLARALCAELDLHASTQMTISSPEGAEFARTLDICRVVVPRELSVAEITAFAQQTTMELEVFIHGALCMSWSGQCLTSEAWGGRSANRGQCAQSCRMPYDLIVDGKHEPTGDVRYFLSPKDLAGHRAVPALMEAGVHSLKIEGRLKGPAYVMTSVGGLRRWVDALESGEAALDAAQQRLGNDLAAMMMTYSRGFGDGFLAGSDHQTLVDGRYPKHRGYLLGRVERLERDAVIVMPEGTPPATALGAVASPLPALGGAADAATGARPATVVPRPGMGIGFDAGRPEEKEQGGPIFEVEPLGAGYRLRFGRPGPDLRAVSPGDRVWITGDPTVAREAEKLVRGPEPTGRLPLTMQVRGVAGEPLVVDVSGAHGVSATATSEVVLSPASGQPLDEALLRDKLGAFGGTPWRVDTLDCSELAPNVYVPVSQLKALRRALVEQLTPLLERGAPRHVVDTPVLPGIRADLQRRLDARLAEARWQPDSAPALLPLVRTPEQLEAVIAAGLPEVELDFMEMVGLGQAVERARAAGLKVTVATVRVQKPGEEGFDRRIERLQPDAVLVRHWGGLMNAVAREPAQRPVLHGDFSLNVTNALTATHLLALGLDTLTAAHDLDATQLFTLLDVVPVDRMTVVVHHHIATFHTEHCVYSHTLSEGRDYRTCGRPCESHRVALRDHLGFEHPVIVDVGCRNTVFNARAQSAASLAPRLLARGVRRFRVEFVWESFAQTAEVLAAWQQLLAGKISPATLLSRVGAHEQFGVTAGTMQTLRSSTAVLRGD